MAQRKPIWLVSMRTQVQSLALLSGLRIQHCCELWCGLQMRLGSCIAVAVASAGGYSSSWTSSLGTSICCRCDPKKTKKKKKVNSFRFTYILIFFYSQSALHAYLCFHLGLFSSMRGTFLKRKGSGDFFDNFFILSFILNDNCFHCV